MPLGVGEGGGGSPFTNPLSFLGLRFSSVKRGSELRGCAGSPDSDSGGQSVSNDCWWVCSQPGPIPGEGEFYEGIRVNVTSS